MAQRCCGWLHAGMQHGTIFNILPCMQWDVASSNIDRALLQVLWLRLLQNWLLPPMHPLLGSIRL